MDSRTLLDYALFQLTPTRTRCDLVIFASGESEKLASGLLEPFLSHLRSARDQISRGGYSIELRPATKPSWFTKSTLQRFVRFVSTPEVLERFVTIEREIEQIESSVQLNETSSAETEGSVLAANGTSKILAVSIKSKGESNGAAYTPAEENSKVRLQRVLETRKAVLRKEQTMAYARALVSGFEMGCIDDLISFAEAFGGSRLREACINFIKLCDKKNDDGLWMDELAAIQACSPLELQFQGTPGVILAGEDSDLGQNITMDLTNLSLSGGKQIGSIDSSVSDSTMSHGSLEVNQDTRSSKAGQMPPTEVKSQVPMPWPNHHPQFMQNFQGHAFQQMPPYQGFPFPGMHVGPQYYPGNMQWPPNIEDSTFGHDKGPIDHRRHKSSSGNNGKNSHGKELKNSHGEELENSSSDSESGSDEFLEHGKKHSSEEKMRRKKNAKKSSRKVVIRNINYIASKRDAENDGSSEDNSSNEDDLINGDSLRQHVEDVVGSLDRRQKTTTQRKRQGQNKHTKLTNNSDGAANQATDNAGETLNGSWDAFQNLLMRDRDPVKVGVEPPPLHFQEESCTSGSFKEEKQQAVSADSFVVTEREADNERNTLLENFGPSENIRPIMKKSENTYEDLLFSRRIEESQNYSRATVSACPTESSIPKCAKEGDWFLSNHTNESLNQDESINPKMFDGYDSTLAANGRHAFEEKKEVFVDDSFMIQDRSAVHDGGDSQLMMDISMVTDIVGATQLENSITETPESKNFVVQEPDDLCMVLERNSNQEYPKASWTPEIDYGNEISETEANKRHSDETVDCVDHNPVPNGKATNVINGGAPKGKVSSREARSKGLSGLMTKGSSGISSRSKKPSLGSKVNALKSKSEKEEENKRKMEELMIQRQKRIAERSAARGSTPATSKKSPLENKAAMISKSEKAKHQSPNLEVKKSPKPVKSSTIDRLAAPRKNHKVSTQVKSNQPKKEAPKANGVIDTTLKSSVKKVKLLDQKGGPKNSNGSLSPVLNNRGNKDQVDDSSRIKEINDSSSVENRAGKLNSQMNSLDDRSHNGNLSGRNSSVPTESEPAKQDHLKMDDGGMSKASMALCEEKTISNHGKLMPGVTLDPLPASNHEASNGCQEGAAIESIPVSPEITVIEMSTPPPSNGMSPDQELIHSRKKWNNDESSLKAAKGFKKLLLFGRKSH